VHIPKEDGRTRPIGISTVEDKIVQGALTEVLEAVYEPTFHVGSYGFRRERNAHDALRAVDQMALREDIEVIVEADIQGFFDSVVRAKLCEILRERVADESFIRLVGKCLHVGILDGERYETPGEGTVQGSKLSPMLGNVYLDYVLDQWFERDVKPKLSGHARLIRYADDFVVGFAREQEARRFLEQLTERMAAYGLELHQDKTRVVRFEKPPKQQRGGKGPATFDFLGFTVYWRRTRSGSWTPALKTRKGRLQKAIQAIGEFCRRHRHDPLKEQHQSLTRRLRGHYTYFGVNGNIRALHTVAQRVQRMWFKWLCRRGQRKRYNWERFRDMNATFPLPEPQIYVQLWGR
jgi:group II intron reverse transcriptase/maturase